MRRSTRLQQTHPDGPVANKRHKKEQESNTNIIQETTSLQNQPIVPLPAQLRQHGCPIFSTFNTPLKSLSGDASALDPFVGFPIRPVGGPFIAFFPSCDYFS